MPVIQRTAAGQAWTTSGDLVVVRMDTLVEEATVRSLLVHTRAHRGAPRLSILYVLVGTAMGVPDEPTRKGFIELSKIGDTAFLRTAIVVPGGFAAATARAFVGSVRLVARVSSPLTIVSSVAAAVAWMRAHAGSTAPPLPTHAEVEETLRLLEDERLS